MPFTFKQFHIDDSLCGMAVSTDGVLLGAWADLSQARNILDIGAGSGLLCLMAAQRTSSDTQIVAVELDDTAVSACRKNIIQSRWSDKISVSQNAIQTFTQQLKINTVGFDHIICNPPYFEHGPQAANTTRASARHTNTLSFAELQSAIKRLLAPNGRASLILPQQSLSRFMQLLSEHALSLTLQLDVASVEGKQPNRVLLQLQHQIMPILSRHSATSLPTIQLGTLYIRDQQGQYTPAMADLCRDFYLKL